MSIHRSPAFLLYCIFFGSAVFGQATPGKPLRGQFDSIPFREFVRAVEGQTGCYFYYDSARLDTVRVRVQADGQSLRNVLDQVFKDTEFKYAIDDQQRVFVTTGQPILTSLPPGWLEPVDTATAVQPRGPAPVTYVAPSPDAPQKSLATAESRLYEVGTKTGARKEGNATLSGYVRNAANGEPVIGAAIFIESPQLGTITDALGYYSLAIPVGRHQLRIKSVGMRPTQRQLALYSDGKLEIELQENVVALKEVLVTAGKDANVAGTQMGLEKLTIKAIKQMPAVLGEADLLRAVLTLPGVKSVGESSTGLNVRGGSTDQNLILFNNATIFNPSHLFGFFSAFNPDVVKDLELYKSNIPARLGGRLSSVLDINGRGGNKKKLVVSGGVGLVTGRLAVEGPLVKDKTSFLLAGRSTYSNWLLRQFNNASFNEGSASFYDLNLQLSHETNQKNSLFFSGYLSNDRFRLFGDTLYTYRNQAASLQWKHIFNDKLFGNFTGAYSGYQYAIAGEQTPTNAYDLRFSIQQTDLKGDFTYFLHPKHTLEFGVSTIFYQLSPGSFTPRGSASRVVAETLEAERGLESAVHLSERFDVSPELSITAGMRFSVFQYLGPKQVYTYTEGLPFEKNYIEGRQSYGSGAVIKTYGGPEYRLSARYLLTDNTSLKVSYNTLRQYIHLLTNTTAVSPTDVWKLSDSHLQPQLGDQLAVGLYQNLKGNTLELSIEGYYKNIRNFLDYKSGDSLILNPRIETAVITTRGKAYGVEVLLKKTAGKLNGWVSYTYTRTLLQAEDRQSSDAPNKGEYYPSNYDKPHDFTLISNYKFSHRFSVSLNFTYSTGRPYTPPIGKYVLEGAQRVYYANRNQYRIPDYYRADLSLNIEGNHKIKKLAHSSWTVSIYNLLGRKNPYSVYFITQKNVVNGYQLSIFGRPIPTVTYNFRF